MIRIVHFRSACSAWKFVCWACSTPLVLSGRQSFRLHVVIMMMLLMTIIIPVIMFMTMTKSVISTTIVTIVVRWYHTRNEQTILLVPHQKRADYSVGTTLETNRLFCWHHTRNEQTALPSASNSCWLLCIFSPEVVTESVATAQVLD